MTGSITIVSIKLNDDNDNDGQLFYIQYIQPTLNT